MEKNLISIEEAALKIKSKIIEGVATIHESSFGYDGLIDKPIIESRFNFFDFVIKNNCLSEYSEQVLGAYDFEVKYTSNYHWAFERSTYVTLHQLNYGIDIPDISDEGNLYERLEERIEFDDENFKNESEKMELMSLFYEIIVLFYDAIDEIDYEHLNYMVEDKEEFMHMWDSFKRRNLNA